MSVLDSFQGMTQRSEGLIRIAFRIVPSKGGGTSSEARVAQGRIPPGPYPLIPVAIPLGRYPDLRIRDVSFPFLPEVIPYPES